ncbi:MAG: anaerobic sulfatase maturase [Phycisphaerae bacterium]|nr:anaerobic sulfatase maturase [Phycisphaerae bacterium]
MPQPFNIMAKPVCGECNLDCTYCYYTDKRGELYPEVAHPRMSDEVLESYTKQYLQSQSQCVFGWQGGEPLLAGLEFFQRAVELQKQYRRPGQVVENALQTNGTLLNDEWCRFLAAEKFLVGVSIDGPPRLHDTYRRDRAGKATFHRAWAGLELLRKHGVEFNVLVTLNRANAPHAGDIYRYFVNRGIGYLQFIPILERNSDGAPADFSCTPEQLGRFLLDIFELWSTRDAGKVSVRFFDNVIHTILYGRASQCCFSRSCANAHVLEFNGDVYACDHFVYPRWLLGNLLETPLVELLESGILKEFAELKNDLPTVCEDCEYLSFCHGGCPKHHMPLYGGPERVNYFCEGYRRFFAEALPELRKIAEQIQRDQMFPAKHTSPPNPAIVPTENHIGRNDPCPCGSGRKYKHCCGRKIVS